MNNTKLIFKHEIPIEVFAECNTTVELLINNEICFKKEYKANTIHKEVIELNHKYNGSKKNTMSFILRRTRSREEISKNFAGEHTQANNEYIQRRIFPRY